MNQRSRGLTSFIVLGAVFGAYGAACLIAASGANGTSKLAGGFTLIAVGCTVWGMWRLQRWALQMSLVLALLALLLGCFLAWYMGNFGPFPSATPLDHSMFVAYPLFLIFPIVWLIYFSRPGVKTRFGALKE